MVISSAPQLQPGHARKIAPEAPSLTETIGYWLAFVLILVLSPSIGAASRLQSCETIGLGGFLLDDPAISCYQPNFIILQGFGRDIGAVYLILPILLGLVCMLPALPTPSSMETDYALLFSVREALSRLTQALPAFIPSFLTEDYRKRPPPPPNGATKWHPPLGWELVTLFRKGFVCLFARRCGGTPQDFASNGICTSPPVLSTLTTPLPPTHHFAQPPHGRC